MKTNQGLLAALVIVSITARLHHNGAYQMHLENKTGSLEVGKLAVLIVLDKNLFEMPPDELNDTKVLLAMMDGKIRYRDPSFRRPGSLQ